MKDILASLNKKPDNYDAIILCDGSGTIYEKSSGWAAYLFLTTTPSVLKIMKGGMNCGTNNLAEMMPIFQSLWYLRNLNSNQKYRILVLSDSEWMIKCGNGEYAINTDGANQMIWSAIKSIENYWFYKIEWFHVSRNSTKYHKLCHDTANSIRKSIGE